MGQSSLGSKDREVNSQQAAHRQPYQIGKQHVSADSENPPPFISHCCVKTKHRQVSSLKNECLYARLFNELSGAGCRLHCVAVLVASLLVPLCLLPVLRLFLPAAHLHLCLHSSLSPPPHGSHSSFKILCIHIQNLGSVCNRSMEHCAQSLGYLA